MNMAGKVYRIIAGAVCTSCILFYSKSSFQSKKDAHNLEERKLFHNLTNIQDLPSTADTRNIWSNDPECERFTVGFSSDLPTVWLASFPRSGNTWTRYLIEGATGVYTNSIYNAGILPKLGYYGEMEAAGTGRCIVTKTHNSWSSGEDQRGPTILLIRNPAKLIISYWNYSKGPYGKKFFFSADNSTYKSRSFRVFVKQNIDGWLEFTTNRLLWSRQLLVVVYEELRQNPMTQLRRILDFIGLQEDSARMACLEKHIDGKVKGGQREGIDPFTAVENEHLRAAIESVAWAAQLRGVILPDYGDSLNIRPKNQTSE